MSPLPRQTRVPRSLLVVPDSPAARERAAAWLRTLAPAAAVAWIGVSRPAGLPGTHPAQASHWLGRELDAVVFEAQQPLAVDALAVVTGLLRGGGVLILVAAPGSGTAFGRRFARFLAEPGVGWLPEHGPWPLPVPVAAGRTPPLNAGQRRVFRDIAPLPSGPGRCCAVLTAPRGRGKSTLLGALVGHWLAGGLRDIVVTAPNPDAVRALLSRVGAIAGVPAQLRSQPQRLFIAPADLITAGRRLDLLVVDEAAALPVRRLRTLGGQARRLVLATTTAGFEGSGRGFRLRALQILRDDGFDLAEHRLQRPVRWPVGDPLEDWVNRLFLLDAEAAPLAERGSTALPRRVRWLSGADLAAREPLLRGVVGLLSDAHYRTRPSDLQRWLDSPALQVGVLRSGSEGALLGVVLVQLEPGLDPALARDVWRGARRPPGHFLPCVLAAHRGFDAAVGTALRVVRVAVHPRCRRRGLGLHLLRAAGRLARRRGCALIGASFGASVSLLAFWHAAGFAPLRVGFRRETTSGLHAAVVVRALTAASRTAIADLRAEVAADWPVWRAGPLADLEAETAAALQRALGVPLNPDPERDLESLRAFAFAQRPFELALPALVRWIGVRALPPQTLDPADRDLLAAVATQRADWQRLCELAGESGRAGVIRRLQRILRVALAVAA